MALYLRKRKHFYVDMLISLVYFLEHLNISNIQLLLIPLTETSEIQIWIYSYMLMTRLLNVSVFSFDKYQVVCICIHSFRNWTICTRCASRQLTSRDLFYSGLKLGYLNCITLNISKKKIGTWFWRWKHDLRRF